MDGEAAPSRTSSAPRANRGAAKQIESRSSTATLPREQLSGAATLLSKQGAEPQDHPPAEQAGSSTLPSRSEAPTYPLKRRAGR